MAIKSACVWRCLQYVVHTATAGLVSAWLTLIAAFAVARVPNVGGLSEGINARTYRSKRMQTVKRMLELVQVCLQSACTG